MKRQRTQRRSLERIPLLKGSPVFIGEINLVMKVDYDELKEIRAKVKANPRDFSRMKGGSSRSYSYRAKLPNKDSVNIELNRNQDTSEFRCDINATSLNFSRIASRLEEILPISYLDLLERSFIGRVNVVTEISGKKLEDLLIVVPSIETNRVFPNRENAKETTKYLSRRFLTALDVPEKSSQKGGPLLRQVPTTRLEYTIRGLGRLEHLIQLPNQFVKVCIYDLHHLDDEPTEIQQIVENCKFDRPVVMRERKNEFEDIEHLSARWFDPDKVWQGWDAAVDNLLHPSITH